MAAPAFVDTKILVSRDARQDRYSLSHWDALILGAAQTMGCSLVLSEDLPAGQELEGIRVVNPLTTRPSEVTG